MNGEESGRVVYDTMLYVRAAAKPEGVGINRACLEVVERGHVTLYASTETTAEVHRVLDREVEKGRIKGLTTETAKAMKEWIAEHTRTVDPTIFFKHFTLSPDENRAHKDDKYINLTHAVKADFLVSGDKGDLQPLNENSGFVRDFPTTRVVDPVDFIHQRLYEQQHGELKHEQSKGQNLERDFKPEL